jgi:GntR family transcriptional regulator, carbon starvation induced regulator
VSAIGTLSGRARDSSGKITMPKRSFDDVERTRSVLLPVCDADTLTEIVRLSLRRDILSLVFAPGVHLTLRELKQRYGVGATPLREALWSLVGEGLIENEAQVGYRVADASRDRLAGLAGLRQHIEPWALGLAMSGADPTWQASVDAAYARLAPIDALVGDARAINPEWEAAHRGFHLALLAGCGMPAVLREVTHWQEETDRYRRLISPTLGDTVGNKGDHDVLYEAVRAGDTVFAVATLERHIVDTTARHLSYFDGVRGLPD